MIGPIAEIRAGRQVNNDGVIGRPALRSINLSDGRWILCVGTEPIDGFRGKGHEPALCKTTGGLLQNLLVHASCGRPSTAATC